MKFSAIYIYMWSLSQRNLYQIWYYTGTKNYTPTPISSYSPPAIDFSNIQIHCLTSLLLTVLMSPYSLPDM